MAVRSLRSCIGDYFTLQRGTTYKSRLLGQPGPLLLGLASIQRNGGFRDESLQTYGGECPENLLVKPGELYVSLKDVTQSADLLGAVARLPKNLPVGRLTQDTLKLIPRTSDVPLDYLYWLLRTPQYRSYCYARATGTTNLGLSRDDFLNFPAPEPNSCQNFVTSVLCRLDDKIELNRRMSETLEEIARALFKSWFVDFDPVRAKAEGRDTGLPREIADLFPDEFEDSELGEIPKGWAVLAIGEMLSLSRETINPAEHQKEEYDHFSIPAYDEGQMPAIEMGEKIKSNKFNVVPNSVLVSKLNPMVPRVWLPDAKASREQIASTEFLVCVCDGLEIPIREYVYCLAKSSAMREHLVGHASGTSNSHQRVRPQDFLAYRCVHPPPRILQVFEEVAEPIFRRIADSRKEMRFLESIRDALLPKLILGQIRVNPSVDVHQRN